MSRIIVDLPSQSKDEADNAKLIIALALFEYEILSSGQAAVFSNI